MDRFWDKVRKGAGCWEWVASCHPDGYGRFGSDRAHRVSWRVNNGAIPNGLCVLHKCDNPRCVRPDHLYLGTKKDNARDREERCRGNHAVGVRNGRRIHPELSQGENNGRAKLREGDVRNLLQAHFKQGRRKADLAREYGISKVTVGRIVSGKLWPNVEGRVATSQFS